MNWKRGFHRLFFVLASLWIVLAVFLMADQLDGSLYFRQSALEAQLSMATKALTPISEPSKEPQKSVGTTLSRDEFIRRYGAASYSAGTIYLDNSGNPVRAPKDPLDTFVRERLERDQLASQIPPSTLSPKHVVIADYSNDGMPVIPPKGYKLDDAAARRVNLAGVGVLKFPGDLDDSAIEQILARSFAATKKYDIFDIIHAEQQGKAALVDQKTQELAVVVKARLLRHRLLAAFDGEHRGHTLSVTLLPPAIIYALLLGAFLALRWIARGFRSTIAAVDDQVDQNKKNSAP
jgi:hypothetical protein